MNPNKKKKAKLIMSQRLKSHNWRGRLWDWKDNFEVTSILSYRRHPSFYINLPLLFLISHPSKPFRNHSCIEREYTDENKKKVSTFIVCSIFLSFKKQHTSKTWLVLSLTLRLYLLSSLKNSPMQSSGKFC